jgi:hypothetical protein
LSPRKINQITVLLLLIGFGTALAVYFTAQPVPDDPVMRELMASKGYARQMRMIGGQATMDAAEFSGWLADLWHGRKLAGTLAVLTAGVTLIFRFVASHPDYLSAEDAPKDKTPPA